MSMQLSEVLREHKWIMAEEALKRGEQPSKFVFTQSKREAFDGHEHGEQIVS